jgi:C4-dicarboxylate-specific signal transduction histidine kinase
MIESISMKWKSNLREIQLQVDLLRDGYAKNQLTAEVLEEIVTNSMKILYDMSDKIDDFRDFFRPQPSAMSFYVRDVVLKSLNFVEDYYLKHNINISLEETDQQIMVKGYPNELSQVILNVMNNSLEAFMERKTTQPEIRLKLRREFGRVILEIADNAGGLEQQFTEDVFNAFVSTKKDTDSCGLGLYIAREIIQTRFKGAISIRNEDGGVLVKIIF